MPNPAIQEIIICKPVAHCHRPGHDSTVVAEYTGLDTDGNKWRWNADIITCYRSGYTFETGCYDYQEVSSGNKTNS